MREFRRSARDLIHRSTLSPPHPFEQGPSPRRSELRARRSALSVTLTRRRGVDEVFGLTMPLWEIALRATLVYLVLIVLLRAIPKRNAGHISPNDMLTLILVGTLGADAIT